MTLPVNDAVPGAVRQLRRSLRVSGLAGAVAAYFSPEEDFAGLSFTCLGSNPRDAVTASDLLAVSLLDIAWRPEAVRQLLDTSAAMVSGLLAAVRSDVDLREASDGDLAAVDPRWDALLQMPGVGTATASKLLARKRPGCARSATRSSSELSACPAGPGRHCARSCKTPPHARR